MQDNQFPGFRRPVPAVLAAVAAAVLAGPAAAARATDPTVAGEVLLKLQSTSALPALQARYGFTLQASLGARPIYRVKLPAGADTAAVVLQLQAEPGVQVAEAHAMGQAPEARHNLSWAIGTPEAYRTQWAPQALRLPEAQALSRGAGVRVAVLDTGADLAHPALAGRLLPGRDFVDGDADPSEAGGATHAAWGHGTHVAGLVALAAPDAKIVPLRVLDADGVGTVWRLAEALVYAADPDGNPATDDGAHIANLSLGTLNRTALFDTLEQIVSCAPPSRRPERELSDPGYADDKTRCARTPGLLLVAAAGNDASDKTKQYPAAEGAYGIVSVAATDATRHIAAFSNSGGWIEIAAPGDGITSSVPGGGYGTWSGTSMAAPLVAGASALLRAAQPALTPKDLVRRLQDTASLVCGTNRQRQLDAAAALTGVVPPDIPCP